MATVTLRWEHPEDADEFLALREQYRRQGWLGDAAEGALMELVGASEVITDKDGSDG